MGTIHAIYTLREFGNTGDTGCESQLQAEHGVKGHLQTDAAAGGHKVQMSPLSFR